MNLKSIEDQVKSDGYHTFYHNARLVVSRFSEKDEVTGQITCDFFCYVYLSDDKFVVEDYDGSIPVSQDFISVPEVCSFIRKKFPL
jgi:hypothetical protein